MVALRVAAIIGRGESVKPWRQGDGLVSEVDELVPVLDLLCFLPIDAAIRRSHSYKFMGRLPRTHFAGALYHVTTHVLDELGLGFFNSDDDRRLLLGDLRAFANQAGAECLAYCLMDSHVHFAIRVGWSPLSGIMSRLLTRYALRFNRARARKGHLFRARYFAVLCKDDAQLAVMIRYIHMNPVKAGLVRHPRDWAWSSYRELEARCVEGLMGSDEDVVALLAEQYDPEALAKEQAKNPVALRKLEEPAEFSALLSEVARESGIAESAILSTSRLRPITAARHALICGAARAGLRPIEIARRLSVSLSVVTRCLVKNTTSRGQAPA